MKKVILNLGSGTLSKGCEVIIGDILEGDGSYPVRFTGQLPPAPDLALLQQQWQQLYALRNQDHALRIRLLDVEGFRYSESDFSQVCQALVEQFNAWLNSPMFRSIDQVLRTELERTDDVQLILTTGDVQLRRLPWHLWQLCEDYPRVELTFGSNDWRPLPSVKDQTQRHPKVNVLATFGNGEGLDLAADLATLNQLPETHLTVLESPSFNQLHDSLWQPEGWDVFFFAGHSQTQDDKGIIDLNAEDRLTIDQIKHALGKAILNGLKIAIFNSCDGLGLAQQLAELQIPYVVVMREPVPDHIAQQFLHYLLTAFAAGAPFHLAVREARQRLAGLDVEIPCASWLPVVWQNPTAPAIHWQDFSSPQVTAVKPRSWFAPAVKSALAAGAILGLRLLGVLEPLELSAYDQLMRQRPEESVDSRIVVVEISQASTSEYGYPLPDEALTQLIEKVTAADPLAIGLDLHRPQALVSGGLVVSDGRLRAEVPDKAVTTSYDRFLQQVEENPHLFLVCAYSSTDENYRAPRQLSDDLRVNQVGFSDLPTDRFALGIDRVRSDLSPQGGSAVMGNKVRRHILSHDLGLAPVPSTCITPYSFSFQLAFQYLAENNVSPIAVTDDQRWQFGSVLLPSLAHRFGGYQTLPDASSELLLNYRANQPATRITLGQILTDNFEPELLRDRVVMIGYTAPVSKDYFETPYGPMAGLWVHAHMVSQLMSAVLDDRPLIRALPQLGDWQWGDMLWVVCWSAAGGYVSWRVRRRSRWLLSLLAGGVLLYVVCWTGLIVGVWLPLVPTALASAVSVSWVRLSSREQLKDQLKAPISD